MTQDEENPDVKSAALALLRWVVLVAVGLGAGGIGSFLYLKYQKRFVAAAVKGASTEAGSAKLLEEAEKAKKKSNAFNGAILGATVVGLLGLAVGIARGSVAGAIAGLLTGTLLGTGFGASTGYSLFVFYVHFISTNFGGTGRSVVMQLLLWGQIGVALILAAWAAGARPLHRVATAVVSTIAALCFVVPTVGMFLYTGYSDQIPPPVEHTIQLYATLIAGCGILGGALAWSLSSGNIGRTELHPVNP